MAETEQNKSEEATPFKLRRAREKGTVARGTDLGYFSVLAGLALYATIAGVDTFLEFASSTRRILETSIDTMSRGDQLPSLVAAAFSGIFRPIVFFACSIALIVLIFEIVQVRGLVFSLFPLKPDFGWLNPAKGFKRLFSIRMLKETVKSVLKLAAYAAASAVVITDIVVASAPVIVDAGSLVHHLHEGAMRLIFVFTLLAVGFAILDQILARREFAKQMRMSRSELTREIKDREGDFRIKRRRKELHAAFASQNRSMRGLPGSDMLIVNPEHYAVSLVYTSPQMEAPQVRSKGRNLFALQLKREAAKLSIPIFESPALARALYRACAPGDEVPQSEYRSVVNLYLRLAATRRRLSGDQHA